MTIKWSAVGKGLLFGLKVAGKLVALGVIHGKTPEQIVTTAQKIEQAIEDAKAQP